MIFPKQVQIKYINTSEKGFVLIEDILLDRKIIYLNKNLKKQEFMPVFLHELAHLNQLNMFNKRALISFCFYFEDINFHDQNFEKIYNKLLKDFQEVEK